MKNIIHNSLNSLWASYFLLFVLFWIVAAASFSGFIGKWGLRDGADRFGIEAMLDRTASRPFVYRQLVPMTANLLDSYIPNDVINNLKMHEKSIIENICPDKTFARAFLAKNPEIRLRYVIVCYVVFISLFISLFVLRAILLQVGCGKYESILAPISIVLAFPYLQTIGGYFYDGTEILFLSLTFLVALRGNALVLAALVIPATLNKETFFFFVPALFPILKSYYGVRRTALLVLLYILISGAVNVVVKQMFAGAAGGVAEFHLLENFSNYLHPWAYRQFEITYGISGPKGMSIVTLAAVAIISYRGWRYCSDKIKQHILVASAVNLPLFMAFAATGELRNLSLVIVGFTILSANAIAQVKLHSAK